MESDCAVYFNSRRVCVVLYVGTVVQIHLFAPFPDSSREGFIREAFMESRCIKRSENEIGWIFCCEYQLLSPLSVSH